MTTQDQDALAWPVQVFYDGGCRVCATEIEHYRTLEHAGRLDFIDISAPAFQAESYGRSQQQFMISMHVRDAAGRCWCGVAAFPVIWRALPGPRYRWLVAIVSQPGVFQLASFGYWCFARLRKFLPKTSRRCDSDQCHPHDRT